jgi:regulator of replication initiation timing
MENPSVVFYEHDFTDSIVTSLSKSVLNLGNECRALAEENTRLKAEVERLNDLIISGGAVNPDPSIYV